MKTTKKINPQLAIAASGLILVSLLFVFGQTVARKEPVPPQPVTTGELSITQILSDYKKELKPYQLDHLTRLEKERSLHAYHELAAFWRDSLQAFLPYAWYTGEAAKLENSEKSLTFAAHLLEGRLMEEGSPPLQHWLASNAKVPFEKALALNPANDSSQVGLGACYIFGNISDNPMEGILKVRAIADKNPENVYAQKILAIGGLKTGQYDKAIERLTLVLKKQPNDMEVIFRLAEAYEGKGDKENAIAQYEALKKLINIPEAKADIQHRIEDLKNNETH